MPIEITMPKLSDTMVEGTILQWHIKPGDKIKRGDVIAEVETDKAAMDMEAYEDGIVSELKVDEGETVSIGTLMAILVADMKIAGTEEPEVQKELDAEKESEAEVAAIRSGPVVPAAISKRRVVSPAAKHLADKHGIDLSKVHGSGPGGRVILVDVETRLGCSGANQKERSIEKVVGNFGSERERRSDRRAVKIRRIMARKMTDSWQNVPHFHVTFTVDMTDIIRFRKDLGLTVNDFVLAGVTHSLMEHPWVNSWWVDGEAVEQSDINIALAIATDRGLYNPVLKKCGELSLRELSRKATELGRLAHTGKLSPEDMDGGTFTVSNMGMLGVDSFRAIITPPQAAVLAIGTVKGEVIVDERGDPAVAPVMRMTLAADHRILDGADAAEFMATLKSYLEAPVTLISH
jgi:pyruvate dehydrogenase E2 component (dihydrolipoyllysine-residue acetyltransferase)